MTLSPEPRRRPEATSRVAWRGVLGVIALSAVLVRPAATSGDTELELVSRPGPWPVVSQLIGYRGRLWFANSVKFRNHNSADLYSYDTNTGMTRYETHLFSQDAGAPAVSHGLLYWPFEDSRFSMGRGELMITNGEDWRWVTMAEGEVFHVHALAAHRDALYAATSAWRAGLQRSTDHGRSWEPIHEHETPSGRVSRFTGLTVLKNHLYAGLAGPSRLAPKLFELTEPESVRPLAGWPPGRRSSILAVHAGWLYATNHDDTGRRVWRTDGQRSQPVAGLDEFDVRAMAPDEDDLLAVVASGDGGALLRNNGGREWSAIHEFGDAVPVDVTVYRNNIYVGTQGPGDRGGLWRVPRASAKPGHQPPTPLPQRVRRPLSGTERTAMLRELDEVLKGAADFGAYRARLDAVLTRLAAAGDPETGAALSRRLARERESGTLSVFGGAYDVELATANDWYLLRAIALNGHGRIPLRLLTAPWHETRNDAEKYFHPAPAAAWAAARIVQNDDGTIEALVDRLRRDEPAWLQGDWIGALTALTGERFGHDPPAWRRWRRAYRSMVPIPAGDLLMGSDSGPKAETPAHEVFLPRFYIDRHEATNNEFAHFVRATGHVTDAERSGVGWHWDGDWRRIAGADWRHPRGPDTSIRNIGDHPVVQVSWHDVRAYCAWRGKRLPTEAEWERAARGGGERRFAWGDEPVSSGGVNRASYGTDNCCGISDADGFLYTAPVGSFPAGRSPRGVYDLTGNVWEWVMDSYDKDFYSRSPRVDPRNLAEGKPRVIRGGGWGNNPWGLRATLRHANPPGYALSMVGIRCAKDPPGMPADSGNRGWRD